MYSFLEAESYVKSGMFFQKQNSLSKKGWKVHSEPASLFFKV